MKTKITKTIGGRYAVDTGDILSPGHRVSAGSGDDYDTGTIDSITGDVAIVRWDSLVLTPLDLDRDDVIVIGREI